MKYICVIILLFCSYIGAQALNDAPEFVHDDAIEFIIPEVGSFFLPVIYPNQGTPLYESLGYTYAAMRVNGVANNLQVSKHHAWSLTVV